MTEKEPQTKEEWHKFFTSGDKFDFKLFGKDLYIIHSDGKKEKLPNNSVTKWLQNKLKEDGDL